MKFMHLSDLHIGKRVNEYSMLEDQRYILKQIISAADEHRPDAILIAGDIYDKAVPSAEAVQLCDEFLVMLSGRNIPVFIISGNHDCPERLSFGNRLICASGIHISPVYNGTVSHVTLTDSHGEVNVYMLPFVKPAHVRRYFPNVEITSYTDALSTAIGEMKIDTKARNVLLSHQFVTGATQGGSEELYIGGSENVDASVFDDFDYVALGHIHGAQNVSSERIRYCGTPLKYSFIEAKHHKSITMVELNEKRSLNISTIPLTPKRDMVELKGTYNELTDRRFYENTSYSEDYTHITLTDEEDVPEAMSRLRTVYHNLMRLDYDNKRTRSSSIVEADAQAMVKSPLELFEDLYKIQNGQEMSTEQKTFMTDLIEKIAEGEV